MHCTNHLTKTTFIYISINRTVSGVFYHKHNHVTNSDYLYLHTHQSALLVEVGFPSNLRLAAPPCVYVQACQTLHTRNWTSSLEYDADLGGRGCGRVGIGVVIPRFSNTSMFMRECVQELPKSDQLTVNTQDADEGGLVVTHVQQYPSTHVCGGMCQSVQHVMLCRLMKEGWGLPAFNNTRLYMYVGACASLSSVTDEGCNQLTEYRMLMKAGW